MALWISTILKARWQFLDVFRVHLSYHPALHITFQHPKLSMQTITLFTPGQRIFLRGEDFLITKVEANYQQGNLLYTEGASKLVRGRRFFFNTAVAFGVVANSFIEPDWINKKYLANSTHFLPDKATTNRIGLTKGTWLMDRSLKAQFFSEIIKNRGELECHLDSYRFKLNPNLMTKSINSSSINIYGRLLHCLK